MNRSAIHASARGPRAESPETELVLAFVNTRADGDGRQELFGDAGAFSAWLSAHDRAGGQNIVTAADAATARELRDALVTMLLAHSGDQDSLGAPLEAAEQHLRRAGSLYPLVSVVTADGATLTSEQTGVAGVFARVLAAVTTFAQQGDWQRLKACRNPPCHFGFFDRTRNGAARYCSPSCGSAVSMRNYRERKRQQDAAATDGN
ncbi:CGNR zinc finger domain-containing protein [Streptomyces brasiliensis]|uniref:Zinc finger CGNR domain-containing protein n=1 Tax=Streptomyces brasiliensis TaxID=1954 RepID=A0A917KU79_9ACTN|nr:CGNR zinc finger domain-containing protein [Streptomyces brasiliensis]GGJ28088.1 hypothetical protein GCM10010121_044230 [Streptomyces brasiliensis]